MSFHFKLTAVVLLGAMCGCNAKPEIETATPANVTAVVSKEAATRLEEADKADGVADHVVGKCYVCGLGMNGSEKYAVKVEDYQVHLCSEACQHEFAEHADEIVARTAIPNSNKPE